MLVVDPAPDQRLQPGEAGPGVRAEDPTGVADHGVDALPLVEEDRDRAVQVVLALAVIAIEERQGREQEIAPEGDPVRRHLVDLPNGGRGIPAFDHVDDAGALADDAAVAARLVEDRRSQGDRRAGPAVRGQELLQVGAGDGIEIAVRDEDVVHLAHGLLCELDRVAGTELLRLLDEDRGRLQPPGSHGVTNVIGAVTDDHDDAFGFRRAHRLQDVPQERASADRMEHLRSARLQSFALARGEHHGGERCECAWVSWPRPSFRPRRSSGAGEDRGHGPIRPRGCSGGRSRTSIPGSKGPCLAVRPPRRDRRRFWQAWRAREAHPPRANRGRPGRCPAPSRTGRARPPSVPSRS